MNVIRRQFANLQVKSLSRNYQLLLNRCVGYKSAISLENLYPESNLRLTTPVKPESSLSSKFSGYIPVDQLEITYTKSSGPGGQNVNKVNTKVNLRFHLQSAKWLADDLKVKLADKLRTSISKDGYLIFKSDLTRSQHLNLADCMEKLRKSIVSASYEAPAPSAETEEKWRRRLERAARERLMVKRARSQIKADRQAPDSRDL